MKINKQQFNIWLEALYSEKYPKGTNYLETDDHKFCCLGVACKELIPLKKQKFFDYTKNRLFGYYPNSQEAAPNWLFEIDSNMHQKLGINLSSLNDNEGFTHAEIAMVLDWTYNYGALD